MNLYVVYLGGKLSHARMGEDHEVVVVAAEDVNRARSSAKKKWRGIGDPHVDAVRQISVVDGYRVELVSSELPDSTPLDSTWTP